MSKKNIYMMVPFLFILFTFIVPGGTAFPAGGGELKIGGRGPEVKLLQEKLKESGYYPDSEVSGYFGLTTFTAVADFERAAGLKIDGIVGSADWQVLNSGNYPSRGEGPGRGGPSETKLAKRVLGYYTEDYQGDRLSYDSLAGNGDLIDNIATFSYLADGEGNLTGQPISKGVELAEKKGVKSLMLVHNIHNYIDADSAHTLLADKKNRANLVKNILQLIQNNGFDGVNIDLESVPAADRENYTALLAELKEVFKPYGYLLTVSIPAKTADNPQNNWNGAYDYNAIGRLADLVTLMTYDEHWFGGEPGPVASLPWVQGVLDYATKAMPREKILMGIAAYGYDWPDSGQARAVLWSGVDGLAAKYGSAARWNDQFSSPFLEYWDVKGIRHEVWFENKYSLALKLDLVNSYNIGGIAVWRLGFEDYTFWETVKSKFS
ncbi:MAG: peptidoglycan-binding protein [Firmicutes bacterium]|nr:peptidoglycan-binding protein [Bacillota bacterium]